MARSSGIIGKGCTLQYSDTEGGSYTALAELTNVPQPSSDVAKVDFTHYSSDSSSGEFKTGTWKNPGDIEVELNYTKANATLCWMTLNGVEKFWKIILPDGSFWRFQGFLANPGGAIPNKDRVTQTATLRIISKIDYLES